MSETPIINRRKKVFIQSDHPLAFTGFGKVNRVILEYLFKTKKYDLVNFAVGSIDTQIVNDTDRMPWKTIASVNAQQLEQIKRQNDPRSWGDIERMAGYGAFALDQAVKQEKPDIFIGMQDIWGIDFAVDKKWFKKIPSVLWTTLDSLPILTKAVDLAPKVQNYWSWADFATKALHKLGHTHVKTVRGPIDTHSFHRLSDEKRKALRTKFGIPDHAFVVGFVFRNQLRKSVPNLLQGYKIFKQEHPDITSRLLLHTCWTEGWDIPTLCKEHNVPMDEILTTYVCKNCRNYQVKAFNGPEHTCPTCKAEKQFVTTHPTIGIDESELNEVYNLMDVYCHPFTSGGQEIPIQEAKLTELITLVTNYSCGEDMCVDEAGSLPLDWAEYREPGSQFIKASTYPSSIVKQLGKVEKMKLTQRREMGKKARRWVLDNFSIEVLGPILEAFIDSAPLAQDDYFVENHEFKDPFCSIPEMSDDKSWLLFMYKNILKNDIFDNDEGLKYWMIKLKEGIKRSDIEQYFRKVATDDNQKNQQQVSFESLLRKDDKGRVILVQPESAGDIFLVTALFKSIKARYPDWTFYVATKKEFKELLDGNPYMDVWLEYNPQMDNLLWLEGNATHAGYFNVAYQPYVQTQRMLTYLHGGCDKIDFDLH